MLSAGMLSWTDAEFLYVEAVAHAENNVRTLHFCRQYHARRAMLAARLQFEIQLRENQRPFRKIDAVDQWLEQYTVLKDQYKFLVLDGKSGMGKTRFAANLASAERFLCIDCASATEPDLRSFDRDQHDVVLLDDARPEMILRMKRLAQASVDEVRLGQSATHVNSYAVWFHRVKLVVASNVWKSQLETCSPEDKAWLDMNSVYVFVDEPLHE